MFKWPSNFPIYEQEIGQRKITKKGFVIVLSQLDKGVWIESPEPVLQTPGCNLLALFPPQGLSSKRELWSIDFQALLDPAHSYTYKITLRESIKEVGYEWDGEE